MDAKLRMLVVEDEVAIRTGLCDVLAYHGWMPTGVATGEDGLTRALEQEHALVVLDVMLPGLSGFDVCRELRARRPRQAILLLTARGAEGDILEGFRCGCDDYVTKPFSVAELVARVEALLRRAGHLARPEPEPFDAAGLRIDPTTRTAVADGRTVALSRREVDILALLARERGRIVSRRMLLVEVWGLAHVERIRTRTVDVHLAKLRRKLGGDERFPIETVRGEGYRLVG